MKALVNVISHALAFILIPLLFIIYAFILLIFSVAKLLFYVFDKTEQKRAHLISKILFPIGKK